ncbi:MAG: hypothetical protein AABX83_00915 [Nanoarchaeota archaeon]|mgnify:CR=1 FL=1
MVQNEKLLEIVIVQLGEYLLQHNPGFKLLCGDPITHKESQVAQECLKNGMGTLTVDEPHMIRYQTRIGGHPTLLTFGYDLNIESSHDRYLGKIALKEIPNAELLEKIVDNGTIQDPSNPNQQYGWCIAEVPSKPLHQHRAKKSPGIIAVIKDYFNRSSK